MIKSTMHTQKDLLVEKHFKETEKISKVRDI